MKIVNDSIKNALKQPTTQRKGRILVNDQYYEVFNVEYYADAYNEGNVVGNAIASQLDFDLPYMPKFDTFKYFDGVWTGTEYEYVDMGTFTVFDEKDEDEFNKHITAFDNLIKFNVPFIYNKDYPKTIFEELQNICEQAGVVLVNASITNGNFEIQDNQFVNNESLKSVLKAICQISGTYAIIKEDKLVLQLKNETSEILNKSQHAPVTWKRRTYGINQVVLGLEDVVGEYVIRQDEEDIAINGVHKLVINDNPFAYTQEKRDLLIDELFNQVKGFGYVPFELKGEWLNYIDVGDTINIDGIDTILLRVSGKSPNALESEMSAPAIIDSAIQYADNTASIKSLVKRTEIKVDKQQGEITALSSRVTTEVNTLNGKINGVSASFEDFKDNEYINSIANLQDQIDGAIQFWNGSEIPTIDNYPANEWITEADKNNHRADIYTVIQDIDGEMKQGKSYRFDKVGNVWQWIELTDNELSAVQAIAQESLNKVNNILNTRQSVSGNSRLYLENALEHDAIEYGIDGKSEQETNETSPSPDYPSEIESVGVYNEETGKYEIGIKVTGKNLAYNDWAEEFVGRVNSEARAKLETHDGRNCLWYSANAGYQEYDKKYLFKIDWKENTQYTIMFDVFSTSTDANIAIEYTDNTYSRITNVTLNTWKKYKLTSEKNKTIKYIRGYYSIGSSYIDLDTFMVYEGTEDAKYEAYKENITTILLNEPLRSLPNGVKDKLYVQNNKLYVERYVGSVVLDGSENWGSSGSNATRSIFYSALSGKMKPYTNGGEIPNLICSHFKPVSQNTTWKSGEISRQLNTNNIFLIMPSGYTIDSFKTWLSTNNVQVDYELATPITEELGGLYIPLFEGINNVSLIANMDTDTNITYLLKTLLSGEYFTKTETQAYIQITEDKIISEVGTKIDGVSTLAGNNYQELLKKFDGYTPQSDFVSLEKNVQQIQTDTYTKTEINTKLTDGSVTKVLTTSGTFDENGMHYEKTGAKTSSTINEKGVGVDSTTTGEELLFAGYDEEINQTIVRTENLTVRKYLVIGENSRIEDYGNGGGVFIL